MNPRFQRNTGVLPRDALDSLGGLTLVVAGCGGAGGQVVIEAARLGVAHFVLADPDHYERHNINRQWGAFEHTLGQFKIDVLKSAVLAINPEARVYCFHQGISAETIQDVLSSDLDPLKTVVLENIDYSGLEAKILLHQRSRQRGFYCLTALMLGFGSLIYGFRASAPQYEEIFLKTGRFELKTLVPRMPSYLDPEVLQNLEKGTGHAPTCVIGASLCSALMISELVRFARYGVSRCINYPEYRSLDLLEDTYAKFSEVANSPKPQQAMDSVGV